MSRAPEPELPGNVAGPARGADDSPLANRLRPQGFSDFHGQQHIVGPGRLLRRAIEADQLSSLIFYGPPGTGKTTLAAIIAAHTRTEFLTVNAVLCGVKDIRAAIDSARRAKAEQGRRTTLFVDEVHRWNKSQQDALLPHVENGLVILIGATTENPYFEVNKALISRSRIFQLRSLEDEDIRAVLRAALADPVRGYGSWRVRIDEDAFEHLVSVSNGDARVALNALELAVETTPAQGDGAVVVNLAVAEESIQRRAVLYDKEGDVHYDTVSAFIKSLRGSDPDAALYWMAKMVTAGEDPRFIFRRMAILASEDVGLADPQAVGVVTGCWDAFERVGMPEGRFPLSQAALYLATCPKSNSTMAFFDAIRAVEGERSADVPNHLKDASRDREGFGHGAGYLYPHAYRDHWTAQQYLPASYQGRTFYTPSEQGYEAKIRVEVLRKRELQLAAMLEMEHSHEVLTAGPSGGVRDAWLQRVANVGSQHLAWVRNHLFELAGVERHHLVLELAANAGLLTWEALRRAPEGGVWAACTRPDAAAALGAMSQRLSPVERPSIVVADLASLSAALESAAPVGLSFDRVLGRDPFSSQARPDLSSLVRWLAPGSRVCLAQSLPALGQRVAALLDWPSSMASLGKRIAEAESAFYEDASDRPALRWSAHDVEQAAGEASLAIRSLQVHEVTEPRLLTRDILDRWFPPPARAAESPGYRQVLVRAGLSETEAAAVERLARERLSGVQVAWRRAVVVCCLQPT